MNTIRSTWYGWATFIAAGGGAYYFAKRSINADKKARFEEDMKRQRLRTEAREAREAEWIAKNATSKQGSRKNSSQSGEAPSSEHAAEAEDPSSDTAARYLASKPYRSRKGDRFS